MRYFCFFFQKKKESLTRQYGVFTTKQKILVILCILIFVLNGLILIASSVFLFLNILSAENNYIWERVKNFWYEILILNNGIIFLYLFKHLARFKIAKKNPAIAAGSGRKKRKRPGKGSMDTTSETFKSRYDSVSRVNRILEKGNSVYGSRRGPKSIDPLSSVNGDPI